MIEMLSGALSGGNCVFPNPPPPMGNCAFFLMINPQFFGGADFVANEVARLEQYVRETPLAVGSQGIMLPGDPERATLAKRQAAGISLDNGNWKALTDLAAQLNVVVPNVA
jgi:uncharacterized oxidoreductase